MHRQAYNLIDHSLPFAMRILKYIGLSIALLVVVLTISIWYVFSWPAFGGSATGERLARMKQSPQYVDDHFENTPPQVPYNLWVNIQDRWHATNRFPPSAFPVIRPRVTEPQDSILSATWLGHATVLIDIDGLRVLTDPMLSEFAFPVEFVAPQRLNRSPIALNELPSVDIVTISHDHYDHLDMQTIQHLAAGGSHFFVGLGIGAHLEVWNVPVEQIHEMDWWEKASFKGFNIHCMPARHYSGRKAPNNSTLWSSWVVEGPVNTIYHSGDSGYSPHFKQIGERVGHIDIAFIKIGDYGMDESWRDIHMVPEHSVQASLDLKASVMFPIHWGTFVLSNHPWDEPIHRATAAAATQEVNLVTPRLGERYQHDFPYVSEDWWSKVK